MLQTIATEPSRNPAGLILQFLQNGQTLQFATAAKWYPFGSNIQTQHDQFFNSCKGVKATDEINCDSFEILIAAGWSKLQVNQNQPTRVEDPTAAQ